MNPTVSIVMPVFNVEHLLGQCLDSVLAQRFTDFELICINDGSTDQSGEILESYARSDDRIRIVHQANQGQYPSRNVALDLVCGKYMLSIDCDDLVSPQMVERLVHRAESDNAQITLVGWDYLAGPYRSPDLHRWNLQRWHSGIPDHGFPLAYGYVWMKLYRVDFLRYHGLRFREDFYTKADVIFHWKTMALAERISLVPEPLYHYRVHQNSVTGTIGSRFIQVIDVMETIREDLSAMGDPKGLTAAWYPFALSFIHGAYCQIAPEHRREMERALAGFIQRLPETGRKSIRQPGELSPTLRYFYRSLEGSAAKRWLFTAAYRWRTQLAPALRRCAMPDPVRRRLLAFVRRRSYNLSNTAIKDLRAAVDERDAIIDRLAAENYELREALERTKDQ